MNDNNFYKYNFLTNKAFEFQSLVMSGKHMIFSKVEIGDGLINEGENLEDIISLKNKITDVKILSVVPKGNTVELTVLLDGDGLKDVTLYREIGIYATVDDEEALYAYLNSDNKFDYIIPLNEGNQKEFTNNKIKINLVVGNSDNINVEINNVSIPDNSITMDMLTVDVKDYVADIKSRIDGHISTNVTDDDGSHGLKYDTSSKELKYKTEDDWETIPTGQNAEFLINNHVNSKVSEGVHGIEYVEEEDTLKITKQDGGVSNFKPGIDPDLFMSDLNEGLDECIAKVGLTNE